MEKIIYRKSFASKLVVNRDLTMDAYQSIKDCCSTHELIKTRLSFNHETILLGRTKIGMMKISRKNLSLYLALNPKKYKGPNIEDLSAKKAYEKTPVVVLIKNKKTLDKALEMLEALFKKNKATALCEACDIDYREVFYERTFDEMLAEGLIKKYIRKRVEGKYTFVEAPLLYTVRISAELKYEAVDNAQELFVITSFDNWDVNKAYKMNQVSSNKFECEMKFPPNTKLEFKICRAPDWESVEKGIWKEEIVNHNYLVVDKDLEVEDLIYNFRI